MSVTALPVIIFPVFALITLLILGISLYHRNRTAAIVMLSVAGLMLLVPGGLFLVRLMPATPLPVIMFPVFVLVTLLILGISLYHKNRTAAIVLLTVAGLMLIMPGGLVFAKFAAAGFGPTGLKVGVLGIVPLIIIAVIALVILAIVKSRRPGLVVAMFMAAGLAIFLVLGIFVVHPSSRYETTARIDYDVTQAVDMATNDESSIWHEGVQDQMTADIYPSKHAAMLAVAKRVADDGEVQRILADQNISREILVFADDSGTAMLTELIDVLGKTLGIEGVTYSHVQGMNDGKWAADDGSLSQMQLSIRFLFEGMTATSGPLGEKLEDGSVVMQVKGPKSLSATKVRFTEKPWVEDFSSYLTMNPTSQVFIARSTGSCTSQQQAYQLAVSDASRRVSGILKGMQADSSILPADFTVTQNDLLSRHLILDRFTQRFSGMAGPIWREAMLVDISQPRLAELAQQKMALTRVARFTWARTVVTLAGMFVLICVVYFFLNAATRGYYTWSLRIALTILLGIGVFLVLTLA
jgi:4-amino-4-deoxy-L-arabinose transferase-like glycosyltransferase